MLYPAELLRQVTVAIIPVFRPDCKCPLQFCARFLILQDGHEPLHGLRLRGNLRQYRTIPTLRLKHRSGGCGTSLAVSALRIIKVGNKKSPTARKQLDISIKRTLKIGHRLCRLCAVHQRKKAAAIFLPQLFGGSWWIRKPRSKKQSAGLFFAVCGRPTCSNPTSSSTKKNPQPKLRVLFGGSWWIRTTEALSSRFTVCPHWPLGKAPIFCFASAVSPGDVCYYSKGVSKLQAFF